MLNFLYIPIAFVLKMWHAVWSLFLAPDSGAAWALSIVLLVVTIRIVLFPLFVKQIKSQRAMQEMQPEIQALRKEYGSDRQGMGLAMQKLQKEKGVNPLAGCLPLVLQMPVFIALLHVLRRLKPAAAGLYTWDHQLTHSAAVAKVFGAPISSWFNMSGDTLKSLIDATGTTQGNIRAVTAVLIVVMCTTQFFSTRQIMKRSATGPVEGTTAMVQKLMLYGAPIGLLVSGTFFPLGVLIYWFTNNLWTIGQQFYVLKKMPPPNSHAAKAAELKETIDVKTLAPRPGAKPTKAKPVVKVIDAQEVDAATKPKVVEVTPTDDADGARSGTNGVSLAKGKAAAVPTAGGSAGNKPSNPQKRKKR